MTTTQSGFTERWLHHMIQLFSYITLHCIPSWIRKIT